MIKVFEVSADASLGGAPKHILTLLKGLDKSIFQLVLICPEGWLQKEAEKLGIKVFVVPFGGFFDRKSVAKLKHLIKKHQPQIVHLHGVRTGWLGALSLRGAKTKMVYSEHLYTADYHLESKLRERIQLLGLSFVLKKAKLILAPSQAVKRFLMARFKINQKKIKIIYNGLEDLAENYQATELVEQKLGFIGSLNMQKGVETLIRAFKKVRRNYPEAKLEILGDGPLRQGLEREAGKNVSFLGTKKDIGKYLQNWQMIVVPSRSESFGQIVLEAAMFGKPAIASRVGGLPEVINDGKTGILVPYGKTKELQKAIAYLLENPSLAEKMGKKARERYEKYFTAGKMVRRMEELYRSLLASTSSAKDRGLGVAKPAPYPLHSNPRHAQK